MTCKSPFRLGQKQLPLGDVLLNSEMGFDKIESFQLNTETGDGRSPLFYKGDEMKRVRVKDGSRVLYATVDDEDYSRVIKYAWCVADRNGKYGVPATIVGRTIKTMSTVVWGEDTGGLFIDHVDRDPYNNTRGNLRLATRSQNAYNSSKRTFKDKESTSRFKGIHLKPAPKKNNPGRKVWYVDITVDGKRKYIGRFEDEEEAARQYDVACKKYHGEFALPNCANG